MSSGVELYKAVQGNESFRKWIMDMVFNATYAPDDRRSSTGKRNVSYMDMNTDKSLLMVAESSAPYGKE